MKQTLILAFAALLGACSSDPADVAGNYTLAITNGDNGCQFMNWTVGNQATGITMTITQMGSDITSATVMGGAGLVLDAVLASHTFTGSVTGNDLDLKIIGSRAFTQNGCTYTVTAHATATLSGDALSGQIDYTTATNHSPDCGTLESCHSVQQFNGTRPPAP
jgi:hypothetical protein